MNKPTLRDRIRLALLRLQDPDAYKNYPHRLNKNGDPLPQCHFCGETGLFHAGNGGISHTSDCVFSLIHRIPDQDLNFFDLLAYKSLLHQISSIERYPRKPRPGYTDWNYFCPFCQCFLEVTEHRHQDGRGITITYTMPHNKNCIVTLAKAELEQQGGEV